jgi:uncharacterized membrane protein
MSAMPEIPVERAPWRRIVLPASVILNLFLIAVIGGHILQARARGDTGIGSGVGTPLGRVLGRAEAILPPRDAAAFGAVMRRDLRNYAQDSLQLREARRELDRQIVADPFNPEATRHALSATQAAWNHLLDDFSGTLVEGLSQVSPKGRRKLITETQFAARGTPGEPP